MNFPGSILIVDDEAHIRKYVTLIVKSLGCTAVHEAADGEQALAIFGREKPRLVLLDVNMPRIDGIETLKRLKALDPECVVVMLTSLANRSTVESALELGAVDYLRKDTSREEIVSALTRTISTCLETDNPAP